MKQNLLRPAVYLIALVCPACTSTGQMQVPGPGDSQADIVFRGQDDEPDGVLGKFGPSQLYQQAKNAAGYGPDESVARQLFQEGDALYRQAIAQEGKQRSATMLDAADKFKAAADRWPKSIIEEDSLFLLGECYFFSNRYPDASEAYDKLVKKFENTRYMEIVGKRRFAIAQYWIDHQQKVDPDLPITPNLSSKDLPFFDKFGHGLRVLDKIRLDDPTGKLADDATMAAAISHFKAERYVRADELFTDLRRSFPNSDHQFMAHLLGVKCKLKIYQGPDYSQIPIEDAEKLIRQIQIQFPQEAEAEREFLVSALKEVRLKRAQHEMGLARYYDRRKEYSAARHYYNKVRTEFSDTSLAEKAANRLESISDKPDSPEQKVPWLTKLFPTPEREKPLVARNPLDVVKETIRR